MHRFPQRQCQAHNYIGSRAPWYVWTGEHRTPKKGEYYRSGAIPAAYLATTDDITIEYDIMRPATITRRCPKCHTALECQ